MGGHAAERSIAMRSGWLCLPLPRLLVRADELRRRPVDEVVGERVEPRAAAGDVRPVGVAVRPEAACHVGPKGDRPAHADDDHARVDGRADVRRDVRDGVRVGVKELA